MKTLFRLVGLPRLGVTFGLLVLLTGEVRASLSVDDIGLYGGSAVANGTIVEVQFTGNAGVWVYGDAQTATNWTNPNGSSIPLYCIDLTHDNTLGSSYNLTTWTNPNSISSDALNRVAWAVENSSLSGFGPAATQLLVWSVIDPNFKVINWNGNTGSGSLQASYTSLVNTMNSLYSATVNYLPGTQFYDAVHQPSSSMNQDLAFIASPEPSTFAIAVLGSLGLIGYGLRRRARSHQV
jgi:hypothetical protein